ncbi:hypothetical protein BpHYR1_036770 [Brachionus plicatilis]|uniref:Uncharacterized protein n=1 Tax=Brachionus plicatilis TaxID=10195 RepID=A0A3M7SZN7_BRAPC|nr:hypothetical protein BpHYR1_036770 [Brachionus plicatilis]
MNIFLTPNTKKYKSCRIIVSNGVLVRKIKYFRFSYRFSNLKNLSSCVVKNYFGHIEKSKLSKNTIKFADTQIDDRLMLMITKSELKIQTHFFMFICINIKLEKIKSNSLNCVT